MVASQRVLANVAFAANVLLLFLLLFEGRLQLPGLVQVVGRGHPLFLHLPIGLLFLLALLPLWDRKGKAGPASAFAGLVAHLTAATAALTALAGLLLAQEEGYGGDALLWHKWTGAGVSLLSYGLLVVGRSRAFTGATYHTLLYGTTALLLVAGHLGGSITHGDNFLLAPLQPPEPPVTAQTPVFAAAIEPILDGKCYACHNERKAKGDLIMTTEAGLARGGENGPIWVAGQPASSEIIHRLHLPLEDEHHMPPEGKAQLQPAEVDLIHTWIASGADFSEPLEAWLAVDTLRQRVAHLLDPREKRAPKYTFPAAAEADLQKLNTPFRTVLPIAQGSPALEAEIFVRGAYRPAFLEELQAVRKQLVNLNLTNLPVTDDEVAFLATFPNLEKLVLNGTDITGATLDQLQACTKLHSLALANTGIDEQAMERVAELPALRELFIWNTGLDSTQIAAWRARWPEVDIQDGYRADPDELLPLPPPLLASDNRVLDAGDSIVLDNKFPDATIRYTTDGTEPDSAGSPAYRQPIAFDKVLRLRAKTVREGWLSSPTKKWLFYKKGLLPDTATFMEPPHRQYHARGTETLFDHEMGDVANHKSGKWVGNRGGAVDVCADLGPDLPKVTTVAVSYLQDMNAWIMPPAQLELWAGDEPSDLRRIDLVRRPAPQQYGPRKAEVVTFDLPPTRNRYFRVVARPLPRLPAWHQGKGEPAWVFLDEVFVYP